jgi:hypothetical protein
MADDRAPAIVITDKPIDTETLKRLTTCWFGDTVKLVVDVERRIVAIVSNLIGRGEPL